MYAYEIVTLSHKQKNDMKKITCKICGKQEDISHFYDDYAAELESHQMCHTCNHWRLQHELDQTDRGEHRYAIIGGTHYILEPHTDDYFKGFSGHKFRIRFHDGFETTCDNLWCQGDIPAGHWRDIMPDNAQFIQED